MSQFAKKFAVITIILIVMLIGGCGKGRTFDSPKNNLAITFNKKFVKIAGMTAEELKTDLESNGTENYTEVVANSDGTVTLIFTEVQKKYWLESRENLLEELKEEFEGIGDNYSVAYNTDYTTIDFCFSSDLSVTTATHYIINAEVYCAMHQLFASGRDNNWKVSIKIYNSKNGKLVTSGDSDTGMSWKAEDWGE